MNTTKKHSRWFLALLLLAAGLAGAMMPQTAAADENGPIGSSGLNYSYTTADKTLTISGAGTMPDFTNDQPWKNHQGEIETVAIGDGVSSVGANAFTDCRKLTSVTLPASVTAIGGGPSSIVFITIEQPKLIRNIRV